MKSIKPDQITSQDLSDDALDFSTTDTLQRRLDQVLISFSEAVSETITITLDSANGADYDTILVETVLVSETSFVFRPQGELRLAPLDKIRVQCTNTGGAGAAYVTVKQAELGA